MQSEQPRRGRGRPRKTQTPTAKCQCEEHFPSSGGLYREKDILGPGRIPISHTSLWAGVKAGTFPAPIRISENTVAWRGSDLREWLNRLPSTRQQG